MGSGASINTLTTTTTVTTGTLALGGGIGISPRIDTLIIKQVEDKTIETRRRDNNNNNNRRSNSNNNNNNEGNILILPLQTLPTLINQNVNLIDDDIINNIHDSYIVGNLLGIGSFSVVYTVVNKINQSIYAIKRINISYVITKSKSIDSILNELKVYQKIGFHNNIVNLHCAYRLKMHCYFILDYLAGGDLRQFMLLHGKISQESIAYIIACIGSALNHIHCHKIIHRDVKPENIAFNSRGRPYLTDFGISYISTIETNSMIVCSASSGTLPYLAPEILTPQHYHSYESDFWSLGIITFELIYLGYLPYKPHVPQNFIRFVGNNYHKMWLNLLRLENQSTNQIQQEFTTISSYIVGNDTTPSPTSHPDKSYDVKYDNIIDNYQLQSNLESSYHSELQINQLKESINGDDGDGDHININKDNDNINNNINKDNNDSIPGYTLPYPDFHDILNSDGTLPDSYQIDPAPRRSNRILSPEMPLEYVLSDFQNLIQGLLDLRIPQRLGSLSNFSQFSKHSIFHLYGFDDINYLHSIQSPLLKEDWYGILSGHIASNRFLKVRNESEFQQEVYSQEIEHALQNFKYVKNEIREYDNNNESSGEDLDCPISQTNQRLL